MTIHTRYRATMQVALGEVIAEMHDSYAPTSELGTQALRRLERKGFTLTALPVDDHARDTAAWGLVDAWDDEADSGADKLTALAPWVQQLTEIMTAVGRPTDEPGEADPQLADPTAWDALADAARELLDVLNSDVIDRPQTVGEVVASVSRYGMALDVAKATVRALVGIAGSATHGRPAAPTEAPLSTGDAKGAGQTGCEEAASPDGPTREDVLRTVRAALVDDAGMPASWFPDEGGFVADVVTDAVVALLSRSAAEPPGEQDDALRAAERGVIVAPWTNRQVEALNAWQRERPVHPFTCGKRDDHQSEGVLTATRDGWVCEEPGCDYTQDWAHDFMAMVPPARRRPMDSTPTWTVAAMNGAQDIVRGVAAEPKETDSDG